MQRSLILLIVNRADFIAIVLNPHFKISVSGIEYRTALFVRPIRYPLICSKTAPRMSSIRTLSKELQEICNNELNEKVDCTMRCIESLREWLLKQPHLKTRTDDQWLLQFLRFCKFNIDDAKVRLDNYYTLRTLSPELFSNRDPFLPEIQELLELGIFLPLPNTGPEHEIIMFARYREIDGKKITMTDMMIVFYMIYDILLHENDNFVVGGFRTVEDCQNMNADYIKTMYPAMLLKAMKCYELCYPTNSKGFNSFNVSKYGDKFIQFVLLFSSDGLKKLFHTDKDAKLYDVIPRDVFPDEYGGKAGPISKLTSEWKVKVESYRDWFLEDEKFGSNENKREGGPKTVESEFGLVEDFKKLTTD